ncbi:hypothetical protein Fmac_012059 [Flemingia macrophylla]|uniref:Uncharacterized protein n=1 Tax=Flemingia macrophylla TaxID=520843 RepID=A0ABD1MP85_9FABA
MVNAKTEVPQKSVLQIKQDDKFFCRLLSKESSMSNPSFRMALAVPFVWESQPGTPKYYTLSEDTLPPLTPPPPFHMNTINAYKKKEKKRSKANILLTMLPKLNLKKMILSSSYPSWSSSSSSSKVVPMVKFGKKKLLSYGSSSDNDQESGASSPSSKLCFSIPRATSSDSKF